MHMRTELADGVAVVVNWLAEQPWCTGEVGMFGISWGGFNSLQVDPKYGGTRVYPDGLECTEVVFHRTWEKRIPRTAG